MNLKKFLVIFCIIMMSSASILAAPRAILRAFSRCLLYVDTDSMSVPRVQNNDHDGADGQESDTSCDELSKIVRYLPGSRSESLAKTLSYFEEKYSLYDRKMARIAREKGIFAFQEYDELATYLHRAAMFYSPENFMRHLHSSRSKEALRTEDAHGFKPLAYLFLNPHFSSEQRKKVALACCINHGANLSVALQAIQDLLD